MQRDSLWWGDVSRGSVGNPALSGRVLEKQPPRLGATSSNPLVESDASPKREGVLLRKALDSEPPNIP